MKRWIILGVLIVGLTTTATLLVPYIRVGEATDAPAFAAPQVPDGPRGKVVVDKPLTHEFGVMAQKTKGQQTWVVRNEGEGPLTLKKGGSTCSCTIASLKDGESAVLQPGEQTEIVLEWETRENNGKYSKSASILTSDPDKTQLDFIVEGTVRPAVITFPAERTVNLLNASNDTAQTARVALTSPDKPDMKVLEIVSSRPELLSAEIVPLTEEELKSLEFKSGYSVKLELKPGMPLGAFNEEVVLKTDHPMSPEVSIRLAGTMTGPITVMPDRVRMFQVSSREGSHSDLTLWVRGREETSITVEEAPENLKVAIARLDNSIKGAGRYRMTVTVPPGTPPGTIAGMIVLKTDHPMASQVKIPVNVLVLNAG